MLYILKRNFHSLPNVAISLVLGSLAGQILISQSFQVFCLESLMRTYSPYRFLVSTCLLSIGNYFTILFRCFALLDQRSLNSKSLASRNGKRIQSDRESLSFGMANLGCAFFSVCLLRVHLLDRLLM